MMRIKADGESPRKKIFGGARIVRKSLIEEQTNPSGDEQNLELSESESCYRKNCQQTATSRSFERIYRG
jgi:hypothetical protein